MEKFTVVKAIAAPLNMPNINTDAIVPVRWLNSTSVNLGEKLFANWRYHMDKDENPDFVLNKPPYRQARILVAGPNFGCGSSREHAVWALVRYGMRAVIAPSFSDIFYDNAFKNGLLPIRVSQSEIDALAAWLSAADDPTITVDLDRCVVAAPNGMEISFSVPPERRQALLTGVDELTVMLTHEKDIHAFEAADARERPWIYLPPGERPVYR